MSIAAFRAKFTLRPLLMNAEEIHPPTMLPTSAATYITTSGRASPLSSRLNVSEKYFGSQNRKNHQTGSVMNLPSENAQVWRCGKRLSHGTLTVGSAGSLWIYASSAGER